MDELVNGLLTFWDGAVALRVLIGLFGLVVLAVTVRACLGRRCPVPACLLWLLAGGACVLFAAVPRQFILTVIQTEYVVRIRILVGVISLMMLLVTFESIRSTHLQERYALLWVATGVTLLACVFFPHLVDLLRAVMGMSYPTAVAAVALTFLVLVAFHFSISMSGLRTKVSRLSQRIAILEARLARLTRESGPADDDDGAA